MSFFADQILWNIKQWLNYLMRDKTVKISITSTNYNTEMFISDEWICNHQGAILLSNECFSFWYRKWILLQGLTPVYLSDKKWILLAKEYFSVVLLLLLKIIISNNCKYSRWGICTSRVTLSEFSLNRKSTLSYCNLGPIFLILFSAV